MTINPTNYEPFAGIVAETGPADPITAKELGAAVLAMPPTEAFYADVKAQQDRWNQELVRPVNPESAKALGELVLAMPVNETVTAEDTLAVPADGHHAMAAADSEAYPHNAEAAAAEADGFDAAFDHLMAGQLVRQ